MKPVVVQIWVASHCIYAKKSHVTSQMWKREKLEIHEVCTIKLLNLNLYHHRYAKSWFFTPSIRLSYCIYMGPFVCRCTVPKGPLYLGSALRYTSSHRNAVFLAYLVLMNGIIEHNTSFCLHIILFNLVTINNILYAKYYLPLKYCHTWCKLKYWVGKYSSWVIGNR